MITLLTGSNAEVKLSYLSRLKKTYQPDDIFELSASASLSALKDLVFGTGLFSSKKLVIFSPSKLTSEIFPADLISSASTSDTVHVVLTLQDVKKTEIAKMKFPPSVKIFDFAAEREYGDFEISDAVFITHDAKRAIQKIRAITDDDKLISLVSTFYFTLRGIASQKYHNETYESLHPYVRKKISTVTLPRYREIYQKLAELDMLLKSSPRAKRDLIEDFVIYSV